MIQKKILIALDGSSASQHAVDYVGMMEGAIIKDLSVSLLFVMGRIPPFLRREAQARPDALRQLKAMETRNRKAADEVLLPAKEKLLRHGMDESQIELLPRPRTSDISRDILFEAEHGLYDAVVLGRRGMGRAREILIGSVTNTIVQHAQRLPIWVVGGRVSSQKVLCAVDGSEGSLKAVDHIAFLLGGNPDCSLTLFHIGAALANYCPLDFGQDVEAEIDGDLMTSDQECMDDFYNRAVKILAESGLSKDQIRTKTKEGKLSVSKAIINEAEKHGYGTVVLGRRGENRSFFLGHVSDKVLRRSDDLAVWVVG